MAFIFNINLLKNIKMKTSVIILISALAFLFTLGFMYLVWSFVIMEINALNWNTSNRASFAVFGLLFSSIAGALVAVFNSDSDYKRPVKE